MIIGPPRSGTSLLGRVLDRHPRLATWVEPYYVWEHHFRDASDDQRSAEDATDKVRQWITRAFDRYRLALDVHSIVDKSPRNCLRIPFIKQIFPEARYIFLWRDARDTILSIMRQWEGKKDIFERSDSTAQWQKRFEILKKWMIKRPGWRLKWQSLCYEIGPPGNWLQGKFLNQIRWEGRFGWGPRFRDWQGLVDQTSPLEFGAYQWHACARGLLDNLSSIQANRHFILKYENFIQNPQASLEAIFAFLELEFPAGYMHTIPQIRGNNFNKWPEALSAEKLKTIGPVIGKTLIETGYESDLGWYENL